MAFQTAADISRNAELTTDVCVVGGGPAGITLALKLARTTSLQIVLLESGGTTETDAARELNKGTNVGLDYYDLMTTRRRMLGGGSHAWAGWCRPLDEIDFDGRPWVQDTGWPVSYAEMSRYYIEAAGVCQLESTRWAPDADVNLPGLYGSPYVDGDVRIALWQGSPPTKFGSTYRDDLAAADQITVITDATATEILSNDAGTVAMGVRVASLSGNEFTVSARTTVLAAGALETARLLLASKTANPRGLANENDVVGRYFMEHPHLVTGRIKLFPPESSTRPPLQAIDKGFTGARSRLAMQRPAGALKAAYTITRQRQEADGLLNFSTHLQTVSPVQREESDAYQALKLVVNNLRSPARLFRQIRSGSLPEGTSGLLGRLVRGTPEIVTVLYQEGLKRPRELALYTQSEQAPNRESRVTLDYDQRDPLGVPRIRLDWKLSRIDKDSVTRAQQIVGTQLEAAGLGRLEPEPAFRNDSLDWGPNLRGGHHHLGTARMSTDPAKGVVDPEGRAHTVRDLYVADSSVFPAGGYANPLLTTVAWALRSADMIAKRYG